MSAAHTNPAEIIDAARQTGGEEVLLDRRKGVDAGALVDMLVVVQGALVVFAHREGHTRRHKVAVLGEGCAIVGPIERIELVPMSEAECVRIPAAMLGSVGAGSPAERSLLAGVTATLVACGISLPPKTTLASARELCSKGLARRGDSITETAFSRHMRRLVSTASATLSFEDKLTATVSRGAIPSWRDLPDERLPPIVRACMQIALHMGCDGAVVPTRLPRDATRRPEQVFAHLAGLGIRPVFLDPGWWTSGVGALLAFRTEDQSPVAIVPTSAGMVAFVHSAGATQGPVIVDAAFASGLGKGASQFHATLGHEDTTIKRFLRFVVRGSETDYVRAMMVTGVATIVNLAVPIAIGVLVTRILPGNNRLALLFIGLVLLGTTLTSAACSFVVSNLLLRAETRLGSRALGGVLDRCLRMPVQKFREFSSGDLADRILSVGDLQSVLSGAGVSAIIAGIFSIVYVGLMVWVNPTAGAVGAGLLVVAVLVSILLSVSRARLTASIMEGQGRLSSMVLQFIGGVDTIRSAAAEQYATLRWLRRFKGIRDASMKTRRLDLIFDIFASAFPMACLAIFWAMFLPGKTAGTIMQEGGNNASFQIAEYLVFNSAFVIALYSVLELGERLGDLASLKSTLARIKPILEASTERMGDREQPGALTGQIRLGEVRFSYPGHASEVLSGVSMQIEAGQCVAVVGPSGSGKSTLLQLILGLRDPDAGVVLFDGKPLDRLDLVAVRRQIGAVVQNTRIVPGSILDNIVGSTLFTPKDAERAIAAAGFADEVADMPMGVHTYVTDQTLSGGQVQKLMIARALVTRPKILIFDEATSALDEVSQAQVVESLEGLKATRLVVAHRLSTIRTADRIYVMHAGRIVQSGSFKELMSREGIFKEMARRQMIDSEVSDAI
ncbi:MAG: ATP-binding cassette domain-containing protein [Phycisphaerales bacterium]|nr:ATP-binding cassette domain-containing protein [Phycisphaerales bacterium]